MASLSIRLADIKGKADIDNLGVYDDLRCYLLASFNAFAKATTPPDPLPLLTYSGHILQYMVVPGMLELLEQRDRALHTFTLESINTINDICAPVEAVLRQHGDADARAFALEQHHSTLGKINALIEKKIQNLHPTCAKRVAELTQVFLEKHSPHRRRQYLDKIGKEYEDYIPVHSSH
ncbi:MAG: hypothetical protein GJ680_18510 [Alteromonadaceae bacterium]|nr:hypothetical protein [Alteromonadaceae bacterium]